MIHARAILTVQWLTDRKSYNGLSNGAIFNDLERSLTQNSRSHSHLSQKRQQRNSCNEILIGSYALSTVPFRIILSDLE